MLPNLILNREYNIVEEEVLQEIYSYDFSGDAIYQEKGFEVCRIGGYRYIKMDNGYTKMMAWQCNMADVQSYDIKLPTIIHIYINSKNVIEQISLSNCFKGSQGIPCSWKYLNRRLQLFIGRNFVIDEELIKDSLSTGCSHTFELLYGACAFGEWCEQRGIKSSYLSEVTSAYESQNGIVAIDRITIGGKESVTKIEISDFKENIHYNRQGSIDKCSNMTIQGWDLNGNSNIQISDVKEISANSKDEFRIKIMKVLSKYWMNSGKYIGIEKKFYFSQLCPTSLYGILSQMFAKTVFGNSYSYFQHCIRGLQKNDKSCACIGVCTDVDECLKYFPDFEINDLF